MTKEKSNTKTLWTTENPLKFAEEALGLTLDQWQRDYINHVGNTAVRAGRQSGKSFAESLRVALFALLNKNTHTLIIGAVDRQSVELFMKVKEHIKVLGKHMSKGRPTQHKIELKNGSVIRAEPAGRTAYGLRGFAVDKLVVDEAHYVPEAVFVAIRPMLATTNGTMDLLSTPKGNIGFFFECFDKERDTGFKTWHVKSEDCPRITESFLQGERKRMTKLQYMQEYEAEFLDKLQQFFTMDLLEECYYDEVTTQRDGQMYLGIDLAGWGGDENAFVNIKSFDKKHNELTSFETTERVSAWETVQHIVELETKNKYRQIGVDDGGIGAAILDFCLKENSLKRKIIGLNNARRQINRDGSKAKTLMKEDMYGNAKIMMERGYIKIPNDKKLITSLLSIQFEKDEITGKYKIWGKYSHIAEGFIRALWNIKEKPLSIYVY